MKLTRMKMNLASLMIYNCTFSATQAIKGLKILINDMDVMDYEI